ncbi:MAG: EAL domain-containing protein [Aliiglaciecola sp.]
MSFDQLLPLSSMNSAKNLISKIGLIYCLIFVSIASAQTIIKEPRFTQLSSENGLTQDTINDLLIDSDGFLWLATEAGLNRYDGYENLHLVGQQQQFADDAIYALFEDSNGDLWVSTLSSGVHRVNRQTGASKRVIDLVYKDQPDWYQYASHFIQRNDRQLYIALDHNIIEYDLVTEQSSSVFDLLVHGVDDAEAIRFLAVHQDYLFIATSVGLFVKHIPTQTVRKIDHVPETQQTLDNMNTKFIHIEGDKRFWLGTVEGLYRFDLANLKKSVITEQDVPKATLAFAELNIWDMKHFEDKQFYVATDKGLFIFDLSTNERQHLFRPTDARILLSDDDINEIAITKNGQIWLSTQSAGALLWSPGSTLFSNFYASKNESPRLSDGSVLSFYQQENAETLWVGTNNGLNLYSPEDNTISHYLVNSDDKAVYSDGTIYAIREAEPGYVWLVTGTGIIKFSLDTKKTVSLSTDNTLQSVLYSEDAYDIFRYDKNKYVAMSEDQFWLVDDQAQQIVPHEKINSAIRPSQFYSFLRHYQADSNAVLIAITGELWQWEPSTGKLLQLHVANKIQAEYSIAPSNVLLDDFGTLWISYPGHGLYGLDPTTFEQKYFFNSNNLLPTNMVFGLNKDETGNIWMGSHKGLLKFNPQTQQILQFTVKDGVATNEFNWGADTIMKNGQLAYGSQQGMTLFSPRQLTPNQSSSANVVISNVSLISKDLQLGIGDKANTTITLDHDDVGIKIAFSIMQYEHTRKAVYRYSLDGPNKVSYPASKNTEVTFARLDPGEHTFYVSSLDNSSGLWSAPSKLYINVRYPPFASPLAITLYIALFLILISILYLRRVRHREVLDAAHLETLHSKNSLKMALTASNSDVWEWDEHTNQISQHRLTQALGYANTEDSLPFTEHLKLIHVHDINAYKTKWQSVVNGDERSLDITYRLRTHTGEYLWYRDVGAPVSGVKTNPGIKLVGTYSNITESMDARNKALLFGEAFQHTKDWVVIFEPNFHPIIANQAFKEALGVNVNTEISTQLEQLFQVNQNNLVTVFKKMRNMTVSEHWNGESKIVGLNNKEFDVSISITAVGDVQSHAQIERYLVVLSDISDQKSAEAALVRLANYDSLTGLPNRTLLIDRVQHAFDQANRDNSIIGLFFVDLDGFKQVNDSLGHEAGDELLKVISARLLKTLRQSDTIARLGGDEFVVMIEQVDESKNLIYIANDIMSALQEPISLENQIVSVSGSIGIALYPEDGSTPNELIKNSDIAMYHAKELGRNNFQFFTERMNEQVKTKLKLENQVKFAFQNDEFVSFYQPIICCTTGTIEGFEILMRWPNTSPVITPDVFIPVAEDIGLIEAMTWGLITRAATLLKHFHQSDLPFYVSINLSAKHLSSDVKLDALLDLLSKHNLSPSSIRFEITESALMSDYESAMASLSAMKSLGFKIALDDFGTGYSSLKYLKDFPIDLLKIDKSFVQDVGVNKDSESIVKATLRMAESLQIQCVAEGIETIEQAFFFRENRCQYLQGYFFSKPMPENDVIQFIETFEPVDLQR